MTMRACDLSPTCMHPVVVEPPPSGCTLPGHEGCTVWECKLGPAEYVGDPVKRADRWAPYDGPPLPPPWDVPPDVVYCPLTDEQVPHPAHGYCAGVAGE